MPKRILIFSLAYYPKMVGGAEVAIKEITDRIPESDIVFDMVTLRFDSSLPEFERIGNVNVHRIGYAKKKPKPEELVRFPMYLVKIWYPIGAFLKAKELHKKHHYNVVWSMMSYMGFPALFLKTAYPNLKFLLTLQEGDSLGHVTKRFRIRVVSFLYKAIFKKADFIQAISNYLALFARKMGYGKTIEVIPNGVDIKHFEEVNKEHVEMLKQELGKRENHVFIITTSRFVKKNGIADIIGSLVHLPENMILLIAGAGPLGKELKETAKQLKIENRVKFLGHIPHEVLPYYLHASDIFIRPSLSEGMGNSFIEAMATGTPVIATRVGGIVDFLKDGETGLFCEVGNPANIAQKVLKLVKDAAAREAMVENAKKMVDEKYDWNLIAKNMREKVFAKVV